MDSVLVDEQIRDLDFSVGEGETLNLNLAAFSAFPNASLRVKVAQGGHFHGAFADFSQGKGTFKIQIDLLGEGADASWHLASISSKQSEKTIDASLTHFAPHTQGLMSNYGIVEDASRLIFTGVSLIQNGASASVTRQEAKIILFDPECLGRASPILKIDEDDVQASHAAVVGKLNEQHLYYLLSRGMSLDSARRLLTLGYLKPIEGFFADETLKQKIDQAIEEGI